MSEAEITSLSFDYQSECVVFFEGLLKPNIFILSDCGFTVNVTFSFIPSILPFRYALNNTILVLF